MANLNSVFVLRTQEIGTVFDHHHFLLAGRDPEAPLRGCSRTSDAFFPHHEDSLNVLTSRYLPGILRALDRILYRIAAFELAGSGDVPS